MEHKYLVRRAVAIAFVSGACLCAAGIGCVLRVSGWAVFALTMVALSGARIAISVGEGI